jgi:endonuclease YncB( thermonuclease family)
MSDAGWVFDHVKLVRAIDGDTVVLHLEKEFPQEIDFGFYIHDTVVLKKSTELIFRLLGINTPELHGTTKDKGLAAKAELERLCGLGKLTATTFKPDKYGRWLVVLDVTTPEQQTFRVNDELVRTGFAVVYNP